MTTQYGHIKRSDSEDITRTVLVMNKAGKSPRGRPASYIYIYIYIYIYMDIVRRHKKIRPRQPNDRIQKGVIKNVGNGQHMLVYKTQCER